jgi:hypothetical protein
MQSDLGSSGLRLLPDTALACVRRGHEQKTGGDETGGQHDFVDVTVLRPGASFSMLGIEPEGIDLRAEGNVRRQSPNLLLYFCSSREVPMLCSDFSGQIPVLDGFDQSAAKVLERSV